MNLPDWYCEHCERFVTGLPDEAEVNEPQRCPHCHKRTVVWMTEDWWAERRGSQQGQAPLPESRKQKAESRKPAREWFAEMRQVVANAKDY